MIRSSDGMAKIILEFYNHATGESGHIIERYRTKEDRKEITDGWIQSYNRRCSMVFIDKPDPHDINSSTIIKEAQAGGYDAKKAAMVLFGHVSAYYENLIEHL